ncbi:hypothetical protein QR685DRAFT_578684 [Neurospora intermedia]|uniref:Uncharacterized protein n=1 Tax=Neurospora intermedia TaxID=5142 RepID=A0ABR3DSV7_NEUIN
MDAANQPAQHSSAQHSTPLNRASQAPWSAWVWAPCDAAVAWQATVEVHPGPFGCSAQGWRGSPPLPWRLEWVGWAKGQTKLKVSSSMLANFGRWIHSKATTSNSTTQRSELGVLLSHFPPSLDLSTLATKSSPSWIDLFARYRTVPYRTLATVVHLDTARSLGNQVDELLPTFVFVVVTNYSVLRPPPSATRPESIRAETSSNRRRLSS